MSCSVYFGGEEGAGGTADALDTAGSIGTVAANCRLCRPTGQTDPSRLKALEGRAIDAYVVHSGTLRVLVDAADASKQICAAMAEQISRDKPARCVYPE